MSTHTRHIAVLDNLEGMSRLESASIDLVYLDPPFNSGRSYEAIVGSLRTRGGGAYSVEGFQDQWSWTGDFEASLRILREGAPKQASDLLESLVGSLGKSALAAYLVMMTPRLAEVHRVLATTGSLYLHCDPTASHYLKIILDCLFGRENFRNEIVWKRTHAHSSSRRFGSIHDTVLFYSRSPRYHWTPVFSAYEPTYIENHFTNQDADGRYQLITCTAPGDRRGTRAHYEWRGQYPPPGRHWAWKKETMEEFDAQGRIVHSGNGVPRLKRYVTDGEGVPIQDIWLDINRLDSHSEERVGYETQKPIRLIERMIQASTKPGALILDPFCGSGTALVAAEKLGRQWIGIDSSFFAACVSLGRIRQEGLSQPVKLTGFPGDEQTAERLFTKDPLTFGMWGTSILGTMAERRGFDGNIAVGRSCLRFGKRQIQVASWVPLASELTKFSARIEKPRPKHTFILRVGRDSERLTRWLRQRTSGKLHEVSLRNLVATSAIQQGVASAVLKVAE